MFLPTSNLQSTKTKVGIVGVGAIGSAVAKALIEGIPGLTLHAVSDPAPSFNAPCPNIPQTDLVQQCDLIIECLPPHLVAALTQLCLDHNKDMIMISPSALLINPELESQIKVKNSRLIVPSGALSGIDGVSSLKHLGIKSARIITTKKPQGYAGAPYITDNAVDLSTITTSTQLFQGNARKAATGFPANVNVAATLSLAGIGADNTQVEIWADPQIKGNRHEIEVQGEFSTIRSIIENTPDPQNPKSSMLAAQSIVATLHNLTGNLIII